MKKRKCFPQPKALGFIALAVLSALTGCSTSAPTSQRSAFNMKAFEERLDTGMYADQEQAISYLASLAGEATSSESRYALDVALANTALGSSHFPKYGERLYQTVSSRASHKNGSRAMALACLGLVANDKSCFKDGSALPGLTTRIATSTEKFCAPADYAFLKSLPKRQAAAGVWKEVAAFKTLCSAAVKGNATQTESAFLSWVALLDVQRMAAPEGCRTTNPNLARQVAECAIARISY